MARISIIGLDGAGKTTLAKEIAGLNIFPVVYLNGSSHSLPRTWVERLSRRLIQSGETSRNKYSAGLGYFLQLISYYFQIRNIPKTKAYFSDRDPVMDTMSHLDFYLPRILRNRFRQGIRNFLYRVFDGPWLIIWLDLPLVRRGPQPKATEQLHHSEEQIPQIQRNLEEELMHAQTRFKPPIYRISGTVKSPSQLRRDVLSWLDSQRTNEN